MNTLLLLFLAIALLLQALVRYHKIRRDQTLRQLNRLSDEQMYYDALCRQTSHLTQQNQLLSWRSQTS